MESIRKSLIHQLNPVIYNVALYFIQLEQRGKQQPDHKFINFWFVITPEDVLNYTSTSRMMVYSVRKHRFLISLVLRQANLNVFILNMLVLLSRRNQERSFQLWVFKYYQKIIPSHFEGYYLSKAISPYHYENVIKESEILSTKNFSSEIRASNHFQIWKKLNISEDLTVTRNSLEKMIQGILDIHT